MHPVISPLSCGPARLGSVSQPAQHVPLPTQFRTDLTGDSLFAFHEAEPGRYRDAEPEQ